MITKQLKVFGLITFSLFVISLLGSQSQEAYAGVIVTDPSDSSTTSYCDDYFQDNWGIRLSMDDQTTGVLSDIPSLQDAQVSNLNYASGILSFNTTGGAPLLSLLQYTVVGSLPNGSRYGENSPVDSSTYRNFVVRMYASETTIAQVRWFHAHDRWAITTFQVYEGWHTYVIDLATAAISSSTGANIGYQQGNPQGIEFFPANEANVSIKVDWIQLAKAAASCPTFSVGYNATASGTDSRYSLFADTNADFTDGVVDEIVRTTASGAATANLSSLRLFPGMYKLYGVLSNDWATLALQDPFDMNSLNDVRVSSAFGLGNLSITNGKLSGISTNSDPSVFLNMRNGQKIDTSIYKSISIGITHDLQPGTHDVMQLFFFNEAGTTLLGSKSFVVDPGSNVYTFDLSASDGWTGEVGQIRVDPVNSSGISFALDFIAIRSSGYVTSLSPPTVTDSDAKTLNVNNLSFSFVQPDKNGGRDFAQTVLGNSWNMNAANDIGPVYNVLSAQIFPHNILIDEAGQSQTGDFFKAINIPGNGDSNYFSVLNNGNINTSEFVNICFRAFNKTESPSGYNSVARILWQDPREGNADSSYKNGDDIIMTRGATTYCVDMRREAQLEPALPPGSPNPWTGIGDSGQFLKFFRIDLNENEEGPATAFYSAFDFITLRTDHESNTQYAIVANASLSQTVNFYYSSSRATSGGTFIGTLNAGRNTNVLKWNTSGLANGTYYVYASASANGNTLTQLASGRIIVNHAQAQDSTAPILECERPAEASVFDSELELAGYALDETRLATLEVFIDDIHKVSIKPSKFHLAARDAYTNYAEANNPGFQQFLSTVALSNGAHVVKYVAVDTAGNETTCTRNVTKQGGATITPLVYPDANATPITVESTVVSTPTPTPTSTPVPLPPVLQTSTNTKKNEVTFTLTQLQSCSNVVVYGSKTTTFGSDKVTVFSSSGGSNVTRKAINVPGFKAPAKVKKGEKKEDGKVYFIATCDNVRSSGTAVVNAKSFKNKTKKDEKGVLSYLKSKAKKI